MALPNNFPTEEELLTIIMHTSKSVWNNDLFAQDIEKWLGNFKGEVLPVDEERLLALWLLSHFTYYNKKEVNHLCKVLYNDLIHHVGLNCDPSNILPGINEFFEKSNIISSGRASDSGGVIAYFFRQENKLPIKIFNFSITNVGETISNLIIIDDVTLTANEESQAFKFFKDAREIHPQKKFYLLTLIANSDSVQFLKKTFDIQVISPIVLDSRDKCFNEHSDLFSSFPEIINIAKKFSNHYGAKTYKTFPIGHMDGQYTFGFYYNTPNNSLPIFWGSNDTWTPILKRYPKNYRYSNYLKNERFI